MHSENGVTIRTPELNLAKITKSSQKIDTAKNKVIVTAKGGRCATLVVLLLVSMSNKAWTYPCFVGHRVDEILLADVIHLKPRSSYQ